MATDKVMMAPTDIWASSASGADIVKPVNPDIAAGFSSGEKPPNNGHNWFWKAFSQNIIHLFENGIATWDAVTTYQKGALTKVGSQLYVALVQNQNQDPTTATGHWQPFSGDPLRGGIAWSNDIYYQTGDFVWYRESGDPQGYIYAALTDNHNTVPKGNLTTWFPASAFMQRGGTAWNTDFEYIAGDLVTHNNKLWFALQWTWEEPGQGTHWRDILDLSLRDDTYWAKEVITKAPAFSDSVLWGSLDFLWDDVASAKSFLDGSTGAFIMNVQTRDLFDKYING